MSELIQKIIGSTQLAFAGLVISALYSASSLTGVASHWGAGVTAVPETSLITSVTPAAKASPYINALPSWHLFGIADGNAAALPKTRLSLSLEGVLLSQDPGHSTAIIAVGGGAGKVYKIGDKLPGGAVLSAVSKASVVLENMGRMESLPLVRSELRPENA